MVFYRKYRPQTLEELIGQTSVKQTLKAAVSTQKLAHAYLFCGPKGTGKTSAARILAKIVNCEASVILGSEATPESDKKDSGQAGMTGSLPCNKCATCISITEGSNLDVIEMDAASNRGIEDIRSLRDNIKLSPTGSRKKVYIIDEVHMLSNDAFNALLKTLEEPPAHVLFILATTEAHKIPQTILSRVQRLDFKLASSEELVEALKKIVKNEKIEIDEEALLTLAKKGNGSFRDAEKLLDQLSALGKIDSKVIEDHFKLGGFEGFCNLLENIAKKQPQEALKTLVSQLETGANPKEFTISVLDALRQIMFIKNGLGESLVKPETGEEKYKLLENLAAKFDLDNLIFVINCFQESLEQGRYVSIPTLPLEVAVVEACGVAQSSQFVVHNEVKEEKSNIETERETNLVEKPQELEEEQESIATNNGQITNNSVSDISKIQEKWTYILETVRQYNFSLEALLRTVTLAECSEKVILIEVPYSFHQRILEAPKSRDLLESVLSDILGRSIKVSTKLGQRQVKREELANVELAADDEIIRIAAEIFNSETIN